MLMGCGRESGLEGDDEAAHLADDAVQQFGVWEVAGLGLAVAFRGTASLDDVVIDANIAPVPLGNPPGSCTAVYVWLRARREVTPELQCCWSGLSVNFGSCASFYTSENSSPGLNILVPELTALSTHIISLR